MFGSNADKTLNIAGIDFLINQMMLTSLVLNDWNNAYSDVNTPLARRFSDEFYRGFHLAQRRRTRQY
jgi:hypothetical protein